MATIKFMKHYVTDGSIKARIWYSTDNRHDMKKCVRLYSKDYGQGLGAMFPEAYENDTDIMMDYFDKGRVILFEDHPHYEAARKRAEMS